MVVKARFSKL